jgi:uncharacterized protein YcbK (DUF882 family)
MLRSLLMLLVISASAQAAGAEDSAPGPASSSVRANSDKPAKNSPWEQRYARHRGKRKGKMIGWPVPEKDLRVSAAPRPTGRLRIYSINYKEEANVDIYNPDGSFDVDALAEVNHIFKCRRSGLEHDIDTRLITILSHIYDHFGGKRLELLSGYRFQRRTTSNHFHGAAADIRIPGVDPRKIRSYAETLDSGGMGIGWYPRVGFVHVDVRPLPSYRWIDYSRSNPDDRGRQLPRGFKRKNPES